ncbi:MAG: S-layer family protein [Cyanobacteriota bacterium]|nr:S-layer family protein [Cyanobacteriota bacterium]
MSDNFFLVCLLLGSAVAPVPAIAQILPDGTLPENSIVTPESNTLTIDGGTSAGGSLFHSFDRFEVPTGFEAFFNNAANIENIFSRVTGDAISEIDGLIRANGTANLFLMNPNGMIFGPNARLDIGGSFFGSTAESVVFEDGSTFSASQPTANPLLMVSVPIGLQLGSNPGSIRVEGGGHNISQSSILSPFIVEASDAGLRVRPGNTLALVGGDLSLSGGILSAESGRIELQSVAGGQVSLSQESGQWTIAENSPMSELGEIRLDRAALVDISGDPSGSIQVRGRRLSLEGGAVIFSEHRGSQPAGSIRILASESVEAIGTAPDLVVRSSLGNQNLGSGRGGDVEIVTPQLVVRDGGLIATAAFGLGAGGKIEIDAPTAIDLIGFASGNPALTSGISTSTLTTARSGDIVLSTGQLRLLDGGNISSSTLGTGRGGDTSVNATESIELIGVEPFFLSSSSINAPTLGVGNAGNVRVNAPRLILRDGGRVGSSTVASGSGGNVEIEASEFVEVSGTVPNSIEPSLIDSAAIPVNAAFQVLFGLPPLPSGDSGNVTIRSPAIRVLDGGLLNVRNDGSGNAGTLSAVADDIQLENRGGIVATTQSGEGGNLNLQARNSLEMRQNAQISATAGGTGNGGNITIDTPILLALENSDISANAGQGTGGRVQIAARGVFGIAFREMTTPESDITATSERGIEFNGVVEIQTPEIEPQAGLVELAENPIDPDLLLARGCGSERGNRFVEVGRGGLPDDPTTVLQERQSWSDARDWRDLEDRGSVRSANVNTETERESLVEATGWVRRQDGRVELVAAVRASDIDRSARCASLNRDRPLENGG